MMKLKLLPPWDDYVFWLIYNSTFAVGNAICAAMDTSVCMLWLHGLVIFGCVVCAAFNWYWMDNESEVK